MAIHGRRYSRACCKKRYLSKRSQESYVSEKDPTFWCLENVGFLATFKRNIFSNRPQHSINWIEKIDVESYENTALGPVT